MATTGSGLVLHKPNGETIAFGDALQGLRAPLVDGQVRVWGIGQRADVTLGVDVMYRVALPSVIRIKPVTDAKKEAAGATVAVTSPARLETSVVTGGLLLVTRVTRERIAMRGLLMRTDKPTLGSSIFPLMTLDVEQPEWLEVEP